MVSIHLSSCPTLSSPRWLVWQGSTSWLICTSVGFRYPSPSAMASSSPAPETDFREVRPENTEARPWRTREAEVSCQGSRGCQALRPQGLRERSCSPGPPPPSPTSSPWSQTRDSLETTLLSPFGQQICANTTLDLRKARERRTQKLHLLTSACGTAFQKFFFFFFPFWYQRLTQGHLTTEQHPQPFLFFYFIKNRASY